MTSILSDKGFMIPLDRPSYSSLVSAAYRVLFSLMLARSSQCITSVTDLMSSLSTRAYAHQEDDILFCRTMRGVMQNIAHLCTRSKSKTWGKDGWKKVRFKLLSWINIWLISLDGLGCGMYCGRWTYEDQSKDTIGTCCLGMLSGWRGQECCEWETSSMSLSRVPGGF